MNNSDDIYMRRDVYDAREDNLITMIENVEKRLEDLKSFVSIMLAFAGLCLVAVCSAAPVLLRIFSR